MKKPRILRRRILCRNAFVTVEAVEADFGKHRKTYYVSDYGKRVGTVVLDGANILLVSQFRFLLGRPSWEIPGGRVEKRESLERAAAREVAEEAGVRCGPLRRLLTYMPGTDVLNNRTTIFVCRAAGTRSRADGPEIRAHRWVSLKECLRWIQSGKLVDGLTVTALLGLIALRAPVRASKQTS